VPWKQVRFTGLANDMHVEIRKSGRTGRLSAGAKEQQRNGLERPITVYREAV
jgi:hypothetical protein